MSYQLSGSVGSFPASGSGSVSYALASASASASTAASRISSRRPSRASAAGGCGDCQANNLESEVERAILASQNPLPVEGSEEIEAIGHRGIFANKPELERWRGKLPLAEYKLYEDPNPQIIKRKPVEKVKYIQDIQVKYFKPPPAGAPGEILIKQQPDVPTTPAPPLVIRKPVDAAKTPEPLIVREAPPCPPKPIPSKTITVPGKTIPPPPRKVVVEKLPVPPPKPQPIVIERWLPYEGPAKRKVVYEKPCPLKPPCPPKNLIIEWESADVEIEKREEHLEVVVADPVEYRRRYQFNKQRTDLPEVVRAVKSKVAASARAADSLPELEGDVAALKLVDLDKEGLGEYRSFVSSVSGEPTASKGCGNAAPCRAPAPAPTPAPASCGCNAGNAFAF